MTLTELLREYGVPFRQAGESPHVSHGGWVGLVCPWCGLGTGKFGLGIRLATGAVSCWKCGPHSLIATLAELTGERPNVLKGLLDGLEGPAVARDGERQRLPLLQLPKGLGPLRDRHRRYLQSRGFDPDLLVRLYGISGLGLHPRLAWHLFIPITVSGTTVSYTTRSTGADPVRRYVAAPAAVEAVAAKTLLYGEDYARHAVMAVEGPLDVWAIGPGAVATLGVAFTKAQVRRLAAYPVRCVCFDNEAVAQRQARRLCNALAAFEGVTTNCVLETGKDPADASKAEVAELRRRFLE